MELLSRVLGLLAQFSGTVNGVWGPARSSDVHYRKIPCCRRPYRMPTTIYRGRWHMVLDAYETKKRRHTEAVGISRHMPTPSGNRDVCRWPLLA